MFLFAVMIYSLNEIMWQGFILKCINKWIVFVVRHFRYVMFY